MPKAALAGYPSVANACATGAGISRWPLLSNNMNRIARVLSIRPVQVIIPPVAQATDRGGRNRHVSDGAREVAASKGVTYCTPRGRGVGRFVRGQGGEGPGVAADQFGNGIVGHVEDGVV